MSFYLMTASFVTWLFTEMQYAPFPQIESSRTIHLASHEINFNQANAVLTSAVFELKVKLIYIAVFGTCEYSSWPSLGRNTKEMPFLLENCDLLVCY